MNKSLMSESKRQKSGKSIRIRMLVMLALIVMVFMSSFALAGNNSQSTNVVKLLNGYTAKGIFTAERTNLIILKTGGGSGKAIYTSPSGTSEMMYFDCAVPYGLVTFYSGGVYSESRWSEFVTSWAVTPSYNVFSISKVVVSGGLYDYPSRKWVARAKDAIK